MGVTAGEVVQVQLDFLSVSFKGRDGAAADELEPAAGPAAISSSMSFISFDEVAAVTTGIDFGHGHAQGGTG